MRAQAQLFVISLVVLQLTWPCVGFRIIKSHQSLIAVRQHQSQLRVTRSAENRIGTARFSTPRRIIDLNSNRNNHFIRDILNMGVMMTIRLTEHVISFLFAVVLSLLKFNKYLMSKNGTREGSSSGIRTEGGDNSDVFLDQLQNKLSLAMTKSDSQSDDDRNVPRNQKKILADLTDNINGNTDKYDKLEKLDTSETKPGVTLRMADVSDNDLILLFIKELARFEEMEDSVIATSTTLRNSLFPSDGSQARAEVIILEVDGKPAGFTLYFYNFSTFLGKYGMYIEDLYVREEFRGKGYGKKLLKNICERAVDKNCGRVEWWCLDWNEGTIKFYLGIGAEAMTDWTVYRLSEERIKEISSSPSF